MRTVGYILSATLLQLMIAFPALAQGIQNSSDKLDAVKNKAGFGEQDLGDVAGTTINAALSLVGLIFMGLLVYAGILWMTARGQEDQIQKAQKIIVASVIGLVVSVSAYAVTVFVTSRFE